MLILYTSLYICGDNATDSQVTTHEIGWKGGFV